MQYLAVQIGFLNDVSIDEPDGAHAGPHEVGGSWAPQPTKPNDQYRCFLQMELACVEAQMRLV